MKSISKRSDCPVSMALDILGDKWSLLIVRDIAMAGKNTYNEFLRSHEKIATNILSDRLSKLENVGIVSKQEHPYSKTKILYTLTEKGIAIVPILLEMLLWSSKYMSDTEASKEKARLIEQDKNATIHKIISDIKNRTFS